MKTWVLFALFLAADSTTVRPRLRKVEIWSDPKLIPAASGNRVPQCDSKIYCHGIVLHTVQVSSIYKDSKHFVDMKMRNSEEQTLQSFEDFMRTVDSKPTRPELLSWVQRNFEEPGSELVDWVPTDFKQKLNLVEKINDTVFKEWASDLNRLWSTLGRKLKPEVLENPKQYSLIPVPNPVIVPGGRFLEFYYWDSYWVIRGLLLCDMHQTVKGILGNFRFMIQTLGHIPNGGRVYYSRRSQPPLLAGMIKSYVDSTGDTNYAIDSLEDLIKEFEFFEDEHSITLNGRTLYRYIDDSFGPRPESYREDFEHSRSLNTSEDVEEFYSEIKAAAESGMDFSSRWFIGPQADNMGTLLNIKARSIIPVELNAILHWNALIISEIYGLRNDSLNSEAWQLKAERIRDDFNAVLWSDEAGCWLDYDLANSKRRNYFSASNLSPLWLKAFKPSDEAKITAGVLRYIKKQGLDEYPGGVPNTFQASGEQWDFPNVWAPMQYMLIEGLDGLNSDEARSLAYKWADKWVQNNFLAYKEKKLMYEKYNALHPGLIAGGGEYEIQTGFGWTNGVILELLAKYGDRLVAEDFRDSEDPQKNNAASTLVSGLVLLTAAIHLL